MIDSLIKKFINNSFIVNLISLFLIVIGLVSLLGMKRDLIPQWENKVINISATLEGASPDQTEKFILYPIEESISNFAGIEKIYGSASQGYANVTVILKDSFKEVDDLVEKIKSAMNGLRKDLPDGVEDFHVENQKMTSFWFSSLSILNLSEDKQNHIVWYDKLRDNLKKLQGITNVTDELRKKEVFVHLNQENLSRYQIDISDLLMKLKSRFAVVPVGAIERGLEKISIQIDNDIKNLDQLNNVIVKGNMSGGLVRLKDVAKVEFRFPKEKQRYYTNSSNAISVTMFKDLDTDTILLKKDLESVIEKFNKMAPEGVQLLLTGDGPSYIERQLNVLNSNGLFGLALVIVSLFLFLGLKSAIMSSVGLPLAYFSTFFVLSQLGISIDLISVVGMILIIGILVDDAIVVAEQYTQFIEAGYEAKEAAFQAVKTTIVPITGAVLTTVVAFLPLLLGEDGLANILRAIPWVVIASLGMSLFESFFILPNHLVHFVKKPEKSPAKNLFEKLKIKYSRVLKLTLKFRYGILPLLIIFMGLSIWFAKEKIPMKFDLRIGSEKIRVLIALKESKSLDQTEAKIQSIWDFVGKLPKERYSYINGQVGFAYINGKSFEDTRYANITVRFNQTHPNLEEDKEFIENELKKYIETLNKDEFELLEIQRKKDGHDSAKENMVKLYIKGKQSFNLAQMKEAIHKNYENLEGLTKIFIDPQAVAQSWNFKPNTESIIRYGISFEQLATQLRAHMVKRKVHELRVGPENIKINMYVSDSDILEFQHLSNLPILLENGNIVAIHNFGSWKKEMSLKHISHTNLERTFDIDLNFNPEIIKKDKFIESAKEKLSKLENIYPYFSFNIENADEDEAKNRKSMNKTLIYAIGSILFILAIVLQSVFQPFLIGLAIPFGMIGVIWAFYFHDQSIDVMAMVGIIGMAGVVVNDSLMLVDTVNKRRVHWLTFTREQLIDACSSRFRPILLTSITTLGGVFPMAYGIGGDSGFTKPLALSLGWGLLFATLLTLFVLPSLLEIQKDMMKAFYWMLKKIGREILITTEENSITPSESELNLRQAKSSASERDDLQ